MREHGTAKENIAALSRGSGYDAAGLGSRSMRGRLRSRGRRTSCRTPAASSARAAPRPGDDLLEPAHVEPEHLHPVGREHRHPEVELRAPSTGAVRPVSALSSASWWSPPGQPVGIWRWKRRTWCPPSCQRIFPRSFTSPKVAPPPGRYSVSSTCTVSFVAGTVSGETSCPMRWPDLLKTSSTSTAGRRSSSPIETSTPAMPGPTLAVSTSP